MLRLIVDLVEATIFADNSEWRLLLVAKDTQLIDSIAEKQSQIFSEKSLIVLNRDLGIFSAFKFSVLPARSRKIVCPN
ncbi:AUGMIN subunit 7-like isoform X2 [Arachis hypogaea]|uniref:AUGMIN subunit 7-like isoform X2 n=1 Tax=Arachis hypogaea TaxID=3818 RepID=UPI003B2161F7